MIKNRIKAYLNENNINMLAVADGIDTSQEELEQVFASDEELDCIIYYKVCKFLGVPFESFI